MPKKAKELSALEIKRLTEIGKYPVGSGVYLEVNSEHSKVWILRITVGNKRRNIGLGSYPTVSLAQAREKAAEARDLIAKGIDPIEQKKAVLSALKAKQAKEISFKQCALEYIETHSSSWKNAKHGQQWHNTLTTYAFPVIGDLFVADVEQQHILKILKPIWTDKTETAKRLRGRLEAILDWAAVHGYREKDNPAIWRGRLDKLFPSPAKVAKVKHHTAMKIDDVPLFMSQLKDHDSISAKCLMLVILTACRSGEARGMKWDEIDFEKGIWTIPEDRMKAGREHQVPLSKQAIHLLQSIPQTENNLYVFFSHTGKPLSDMTLSMLMRRMQIDAKPHGFRSTFRDWAGDRTNYPRDLAEAALAHTLTNKVEAAYRRSSALEKRRAMMQDWGDYCLC